MLESVKAVCAQFTAEQMVQQRASVKSQIKDAEGEKQTNF